MKYVLSVFGSRGDVQPIALLGQALQKQGHEVLLCAPENFKDFSSERGLRFVPVGKDVSDLFHRTRLNVSRMTAELRAELALQFEALMPHIEGSDVVLGAGVPVAAPSVAEKYGVPYRFVGYCPLTFPSRFHPPPHFYAFHRMGFLSRWLWKGTEVFFNCAGRGAVNAFRKRHGMKDVSNVWRHVLGEQPLLAADAMLAPLPSDLEASVCQTGAWLNAPDVSTPLSSEVSAFLAYREPPIFVGFGSMPVQKPEQIRDLLEVLVRKTGRRFILSLPKTLHAQLPPSDDVLLVSDVSHPALFPKVAAVFHHGGAGTVTTAAQAGVPQVIAPHMLDQHYWARRVNALGIGPRPVKRASMSPWSLQEAFLEALSDRMQVRAREMAHHVTHDGITRALACLKKGFS